MRSATKINTAFIFLQQIVFILKEKNPSRDRKVTIDTRGLNHTDSMKLIHYVLSARSMNRCAVKILVEPGEKQEFIRHVFEILTNCTACIEDAGNHVIIGTAAADKCCR
jgi:hypothetical protein